MPHTAPLLCVVGWLSSRGICMLLRLASWKHEGTSLLMHTHGGVESPLVRAYRRKVEGRRSVVEKVYPIVYATTYMYMTSYVRFNT